jgi:Tol biopolymer transport system component
MLLEPTAADDRCVCRQRLHLHIVPADGGPVEPLTSDAFNNTRPSWSLDKQWIYFASDRTGDWQIWKMPSSGGKPEQITWGGGRDPVVSWDGRRVYYAKSPPIQGIWAVPAEGGQEVQIVGRGRSLSFDVAENGIFMMDFSAEPQATVEMFSFASREIVQVARLPAGLRLGGYFAVSRDGRSMLYTRVDSWQSDIEMLRGFR